MSTKAIITGDLINSKHYNTAEWIGLLKGFFSKLGESPAEWEIYRGDEFQLRLHPRDALRSAIHLKALVKATRELDVRLGIGLGEETYRGSRVTESNGPAYQRSGKVFEALKDQKINLSIATGIEPYDRTINLLLRLALDFMDRWSRVSAEIVALALHQPEASQSAIAAQLGIRQSAVSQRLKRARMDLVLELLYYYSQTIKTLYS